MLQRCQAEKDIEKLRIPQTARGFHCGQIPSNRLGSPNRLPVAVIDLVVSLDPSCRAQEPFMFLFLATARFDTIKFYSFFPQQRKLMGSAGRRSRFRRKVPEGSGGFRCVLV